MCPLLVTGLGGLYSRLPNSIEINSIDWHRITPDDVTEIPELTLFMNALEFCNAVVQVAHEMIKIQLLDFMYQGFIVPVLGPALLQVCKGTPSTMHMSKHTHETQLFLMSVLYVSVNKSLIVYVCKKLSSILLWCWFFKIYGFLKIWSLLE